MLETLIGWDRALLLYLNPDEASLLDPVMRFISGTWEWLPFYAFLLFVVWRRVGWRLGLLFLLGVALCVLAADQLSVHLFKNTFQRLRPCADPSLAGLVRIPEGYWCSGGFSFVSSHASNVFSVFYFIYRFVRLRWMTVLTLVWASIVGFSRIYLAAHFPLDVLCGALLGVCLGALIYLLISWGYRRFTGGAELVPPGPSLRQ